MNNYDEYIGFETLLPIEVIDLLHTQEPVVEELISYTDSPLDEYELAMVAA
jgi:hypothetical protein